MTAATAKGVSMYYVKKDGNVSGPFAAAAIKKLAAGGNLTANDEISADGDNWKIASSVKGLEFPAPAVVAEEVEPETKSGLGAYAVAAGIALVLTVLLIAGFSIKSYLDSLPKSEVVAVATEPQKPVKAATAPAVFEPESLIPKPKEKGFVRKTTENLTSSEKARLKKRIATMSAEFEAENKTQVDAISLAALSMTAFDLEFNKPDYENLMTLYYKVIKYEKPLYLSTDALSKVVNIKQEIETIKANQQYVERLEAVAKEYWFCESSNIILGAFKDAWKACEADLTALQLEAARRKFTP